MRGRAVVSVAGVAAVAVLATTMETAMPAPAIAAQSPAQLASSAIKAGLAQKSFRWAEAETVSGVRTLIVSNVGRSKGSQLLTWAQGSRRANLWDTFVNNTAYLEGSAVALYIEGFTRTAATQETGKWVAVKPSSPMYSSAASWLTVSSALDGLKMAGPVTSVPGKKISGLSTRGLKGTSKPSDGQAGTAETLYVRAKGTPLPVEVVWENSVTLFSNWGEAIKATAPAAAVPIQASWLRAK